MKHLHAPVVLLWLTVLTASRSAGQVWINEVLFNPPGPDAPNQYVELRGTPNLVLPAGTYFLTVDGDQTANPGVIKNIFDLSGRAIGGNGFLVLLQKSNLYTPDSGATVLVNTGHDGGFGSGSGSSIGHRGNNGQTNLQRAPVTFFLVQTPTAPTLSTDIDPRNSGVPDAPVLATWTILDSVSVLGSSGFGYGAINFRKTEGALALGTVITLGFTPGYIGRTGNTTGATAADWAASDVLDGAAPDWSLDGTSTVPPLLAGAPLNHLGGPNFGAPPFPGIVLRESPANTGVTESGGTNSYTLALNTAPTGDVAVQISADPQLEVSLDGTSFGSTRSVTLSDTAPQTVLVRAVDDNVVDTSPHPAFVRHTVTSTGDPVHYPLSALGPILRVDIGENDGLLLNELKVNPPGTNNAPYQYFELKGPPGALLTNIYLVAIAGESGDNPGTVDWAANLSGAVLGSSGLLVVAATNCAYAFPAGTTLFTDAQLNAPGGAFDHDSISLLLISSPVLISPGKDWDDGDNGILEGVPDGAVILDAVGWADGGANDLVYGGVVLSQDSAPPDAATRFSNDATPNSAAAWFFGELAGSSGDSVIYDGSRVSANFPFGAVLTPGALNRTDASITPLAPLAAAIDDPTNPDVYFYVAAEGGNPDSLIVLASSSNPAVVSNENLTITTGPGGLRILHLAPTGVGYATITVTVSGGAQFGATTFLYAASAMGRPGGRFHSFVSDGSAALAIDNDYMFVGDDENQTIRLYPRNSSGPPLQAFDFKPFLDVTSQEQGEVDVEASTRVGNRLYWLGSHSHNNLAESRTNRTRVFATDLSGAGAEASLSFAGMYRYLKLDLIDWDSANGHGKGSNYYGLAASSDLNVDPKAADGSGFNMEGLTMAPGSATTAWLGFRAPLVPVTNRAKALLVPVLNFTTLAVSDAAPGSAVFGTPIELNLGCRGIRSIEANAGGVIISAGPPGKNSGLMPQDFKLFTWDGNPLHLPEERAADLGGINPEGMVELPPGPWTSESQVQLISDNGTTVYYGDGNEAKHLSITNFKKFRSDWVALGAVVDTPRPCIKSIALEGDNVALCWCSKPGLFYRVQYATEVASQSWTDLTADIAAVDATTCASVPRLAGRQIFLRISAQR